MGLARPTWLQVDRSWVQCVRLAAFYAVWGRPNDGVGRFFARFRVTIQHRFDFTIICPFAPYYVIDATKIGPKPCRNRRLEEE